MAATELFHADGRSAGIFYCSVCRAVREDEARAKECCEIQYCACGAELRKCWKQCDDCSRKERAAKAAATLAKAEEIFDYEGWVFADRGPNEGYFESVEHLLEWCEEADEEDNPNGIPEFAHTCNAHPPQFLDAGDLIQNCFEDSFEDASEHLESSVAEAFQEACKQFNEGIKGIVSYSPDTKHKVRVRDKDPVALAQDAAQAHVIREE